MSMMAESAAENWDRKQRAVIEARFNARILVEAGPGTGKTAVACARVAHLIDRQDLTPSKIWLLSFTRTAVRELRDRISEYVEDPLDAMSVRITTLDSQVWYLRQGLQDSNFESLFGSYEANIESIIDLLREDYVPLLDYLGEIEHVIVDEAQDLVGIRSELVCELIRCLRNDCGLTVFADSAQAIYGFTTEIGGKKGHSSELIKELRSGRWGELHEHMLDTIHRVEDPNLAEAYRHLREITLSSALTPEKKCEQIRQKTKEIASASLPHVTRQDLVDRNDILLLYRYRADVLSDSSFLWSHGIAHKLRMSGIPQRLSPWIARIFWDYEGKTIDEAEFRSRWSERVAPSSAFGPDILAEAWKALVYYCGTRRGSIGMKQLRSVLSRQKPPIEFILPEKMLPGPVLGTIHASKGREAEVVHLMLAGIDPDDTRTPDQIDEEVRVVFVGATRARNTFKVGNTGRSYASKVPGRARVFKLGARKKTPRAQVEFGVNGDVDKYSLLLKEEWSDDGELPVQNQEYLWSRCLDHVELTAEKSGDTGWVYWLDAADESAFWLSALSRKLTNDLWRVGDKVAKHHRRNKVLPSNKILHLHMVGSESVVLSETDDMKARLLDPWCRTGVYLVPVISGYTNVYFKGR